MLCSTKKGSEEPGDIVLQCFMLLPEETEICLQGHWILLHKKKTLLGEESACFHFSPKRSNVPWSSRKKDTIQLRSTLIKHADQDSPSLKAVSFYISGSTSVLDLFFINMTLALFITPFTAVWITGQNITIISAFPHLHPNLGKG